MVEHFPKILARVEIATTKFVDLKKGYDLSKFEKSSIQQCSQNCKRKSLCPIRKHKLSPLNMRECQKSSSTRQNCRSRFLLSCDRFGSNLILESPIEW